jgi:hypothetical protein
MRIQISSLPGSFGLFTFAALLLTVCGGCDVEKIGSMAERGGTKLSGPNAAIGGVNYLRPRLGKDGNWDRHITACRMNSGPADISLGTGGREPILTITKNGESARVVLRGPEGTVTFDQTQYSSLDLKLSPHAPGALEMDGSETVICVNAEGILNSTVHFQRCGR